MKTSPMGHNYYAIGNVYPMSQLHFLAYVNMSLNKDAIYKLIANVLQVSIDKIEDELAVGDIREWDSLAHMRIITA